MTYDFDNLLLEVEAHPDSIASFKRRYKNETDENPPAGSVQSQSNKWGVEARVYFNASLETVEKLQNDEYEVSDAHRGYKNEYQYRINSEKLFWLLVGEGYRL